MSKLDLKKIFAAPAAVALLAAASAANEAQAASVKATCETTIEKTVTRAESVFTTENGQFVDVPGTSITFKQGKAGCVVVTFASEATSPTDTTLIRAFLDGHRGDPNTVEFGKNTQVGYTSNAMIFVFPDVSAGNHTVKIGFAGKLGNTVALQGRTLSVRYIK